MTDVLEQKLLQSKSFLQIFLGGFVARVQSAYKNICSWLEKY